MKKLSQNRQGEETSPKSMKTILTTKRSRKSDFCIPSGSKLNEVYMDAQQVAFELNISKRTVRNMRKSRKLSSTTLYGKIFYYRRELEAILEANKVVQNNN